MGFLPFYGLLLSYDLFLQRVHEIFKVSADPLFIDLELIECRQLTAYSSGKRNAGAEVEIFLVPIGPDEKGMRCEAIFN
jgi:hypothetical protein